jgi:hypothetical protein
VAAAAVLVVAILVVGCTRDRDRFWPDSENESLWLTSPRVITGDHERLVFQEPTGDPGEYTAIERLSHTLRVGDRVVAGVSVPVDGEYTLGGGWIYSGRKFRGRYGVEGDLLAAASNRVEVVTAGIDAHGNLELLAQGPGRAVVTLSATMSRRYADRPEDAETFTDTVVFAVEE